MSIIIGPIDRVRWNVLRTYHSALKYHTDTSNGKARDQIKTIYTEAKKGIY